MTSIQRSKSASADFIAWNFSSSLNPKNGDQTDQTCNDSNGTLPAERKRRALIVDDVPDVTDMLSVLLTHAGYNVATAGSAAAALAIAANDQFDVVISDIGMPEMNGYELAKALRKMPGYEEIPMVAVTGYSMFNDREQSLRSGFTAHMTKPIDPRELVNLIDQL